MEDRQEIQSQPDMRSPSGLIRNGRDFWGGVALLLLAITGYYASLDLPGMTGFRFGPGTAPHLYAALLGILGLLLAGGSLIAHGPAAPTYSYRGPTFVLLSIFLFAVLIRPMGLVLASFSMFLFAAIGSSETRWMEAVVAGAALTLFCVVLFVHLLGLPFSVWPGFTVLGFTIGIVR